MICHPAVFEFHFRISQGPMLGNAPFHTLAPQAKGVGMELVPHEANDIRF
jgi:hypothetical protein